MASKKGQPEPTPVTSSPAASKTPSRFTIESAEVLIKQVGPGKAGGKYQQGRISLPASWIGKDVLIIAIESAELETTAINSDEE